MYIPYSKINISGKLQKVYLS